VAITTICTSDRVARGPKEPAQVNEAGVSSACSGSPATESQGTGAHPHRTVAVMPGSRSGLKVRPTPATLEIAPPASGGAGGRTSNKV